MSTCTAHQATSAPLLCTLCWLGEAQPRHVATVQHPQLAPGRAHADALAAVADGCEHRTQQLLPSSVHDQLPVLPSIQALCRHKTTHQMHDDTYREHFGTCRKHNDTHKHAHNMILHLDGSLNTCRAGLSQLLSVLLLHHMSSVTPVSHSVTLLHSHMV
jgi:hypothetical protein